MRLKSLKLHNIRSYVSEEIFFPDGSIMLSGDIGAGKSTILLAVEFAFFGIVKGSVEGASLLRNGKSAGYVELCFELDGSEIVVRRALKRNKSSVVQSAGYLVVNGIRTDCTPVELKARILDMLGYPKSLVTKSKSLIYRYTVYTPQEEMKHILFEDSAARLDTLRKVFQIDSYRAIRENASIVSRAFREKIAEYSARTAGLQEKRKQLDELNAKMREKSASLSILLPLLNDNRSKIKTHQELARKYDGELLMLTSLKTQAASLESSVSEKNNLVKSLKVELGQSSKIISSYESALDNSALQLAYAENLGILSHHVSVLSSEIAGKHELQLLIDDLQERLAAVSSDIARAETTKSSSKKLEQNVLSSETCPVCLQPIRESHKADFRHKITAELAASETAIAERSAEKKEISSKLASSRENLNALLAKERNLAGLSALLAQFLRDASELGVSAEPFGMQSYEISAVVSSLSSAGRTLKEKSRMKSVLAEKKSGIELLRNRLSAAEADASEAAKKHAAARQQVLALSSVEQDYSLAKSRLEKLLHEEKELLVRKASLEKEIENLRENSSLLRQEIAGKESDEKLLIHLQQLRYWLDEHFINLAGVIEKSVMLRIYNEFNDLFRSWFGLLMEDETISARLDDAFSPVIEINGYETQLESLSGGEKTSCAFAYRLALNRVINDVITTIRTRDILILDEPTDGFSSEQLEKVRDVLEQLRLPQIIIVSHESKVESFVQNVARVVKEQHISHVLA